MNWSCSVFFALVDSQPVFGDCRENLILVGVNKRVECDGEYVVVVIFFQRTVVEKPEHEIRSL